MMLVKKKEYSRSFDILLESSKHFVEIFKQINRSNQLLKHYYSCRSVPLEQFWNLFDSQPLLSQENPLVRWIPTFYDELLLMIQKEVL